VPINKSTRKHGRPPRRKQRSGKRAPPITRRRQAGRGTHTHAPPQAPRGAGGGQEGHPVLLPPQTQATRAATSLQDHPPDQQADPPTTGRAPRRRDGCGAPIKEHGRAAAAACCQGHDASLHKRHDGEINREGKHTRLAIAPATPAAHSRASRKADSRLLLLSSLRTQLSASSPPA
jgi:hypothetical protein